MSAQKETKMPNQIPDITLATADSPVSLRYIDFSGRKRGDSLTWLNPTTTTLANVQAFNVAMGALTEASLYSEDMHRLFETTPDKDNATSNGARAEVNNNLVILAKAPGLPPVNLFLPAPIDAVFVTGSDQIDPAYAPLGTLFSAWLALLPVGYSIVSTRYTSRKQHNQATPI